MAACTADSFECSVFSSSFCKAKLQSSSDGGCGTVSSKKKLKSHVLCKFYSMLLFALTKGNLLSNVVFKSILNVGLQSVMVTLKCDGMTR